MMDTLLHTPEGVRDIYQTELQKKEQVEACMQEKMRQYGFQRIKTPTLEYFDIFHEKRGTVPSKDMYKLVDRDGEILVLRPDITPQVARCVAKYFRTEELPIRLWYQGNVYVNHSGYQGKLKESTQIGAELVNDSSATADAEMISLMADCLLASGLTKFQIELGQADFFRALTEEARLSEEECEELRTLIESKNRFGVEQMVSLKEFSKELKELFLQLSGQFGGIDTVRHMKTLTKNQRAIAALQRLEEVHQALISYEKEAFVSYDLGMLNQYKYYTGVVFRAYTYGTGNAVAAGGRYDALVGQFGKQAPAIGIAVYSDQLLTALTRQGLVKKQNPERILVLYASEYLQEAVGLAKQLRMDGESVALLEQAKALSQKDYAAYAKRIGIGKIYVVSGKERKDFIVWDI